MTSEIRSHTGLAEPDLSFHPDRISDRDIHPLRGLVRFGPYSAGMLPDPIRVATIAPFNEGPRLYSFMKELGDTHRATERPGYLVNWPGFKSVFRVGVAGANKPCHLELDAGLDGEIKESPTPHVILTERLVRAIQLLEMSRSEFDIVFIYLPQRWSVCYDGVADDFNLHDHLKATTAARRMPLQIVREDKALSYKDRASVMWRVGLAMYAKAGGVPWKLSDVEPDTAYIGISYALRSLDSQGPRFVTCCSQVFDAEGAGLEFVAYDAHEFDMQRDNPFLSRTEMFRVMTRSMDLYMRRHAGRAPRRVMVHKTTEFKTEEVEGAMEALHLCEAVDLVQVVEHSGWRGVRLDGKSKAASFPVSRGTVANLNSREALLWLHGNVSGINEAGNYFQGSRGTPTPLRLIRHAGHGPWDDTARATLALSKMNWNNDALYDPLPVTLGYAQVLARVVKRMPGLGSMPYQFRFFM